MSILPAQMIHDRIGIFGKESMVIRPFEPRSCTYKGLSYGLSAASYDFRLGWLLGQRGLASVNLERVYLAPGEFILASTMEYVEIPNDLAVYVHDKSTLARRGIALQNTFIDPGFRGYVTLEISNHSDQYMMLERGMPIGQFVFHTLTEPTMVPYSGKYQDQSENPTEAL